MKKIITKPTLQQDFMLWDIKYTSISKKGSINFGMEVGFFNMEYRYLTCQPISYSPNIGYGFALRKKLHAQANVFFPISKTVRFSSDCGNGPQFNFPEKITCTPYFQIGFCRK